MLLVGAKPGEAADFERPSRECKRIKMELELKLSKKNRQFIQVKLHRNKARMTGVCRHGPSVRGFIISRS